MESIYDKSDQWKAIEKRVPKKWNMAGYAISQQSRSMQYKIVHFKPIIKRLKNDIFDYDPV